MSDGMDEVQRRINEEMANWKGDPDKIEIARLTARVKELEEVLQYIANTPGELNPCNYDHDDVCACNAALCEMCELAAIALAAITKGESHD